MLADPMTTLLATLGTYLVHSTVLLGLAWMVADRLKSLRAQEWAWRSALLGGLLTTALQLGLSLEPLGGQVSLSAESSSEAQEQALRPTLTAATPKAPTAENALRRRGSSRAGRRISADRAFPASIVETTPAAALRASETQAPASSLSWKPIVLGLWALGGLVLCLGFVLALARLRLHLARRRQVSEGPLMAQFQHLAPAFPIARRTRLFTSPKLAAPIAHGWLQPSVTVPESAVDRLQPEEQRALLAHELGHLQRRDPAWLNLARLLEIALFVQPLNRLAHRRLAAIAEFQCDAAALHATGDRVALARCLTEVAGWIVGSPRPLPACGMADARSPLAARVVRILESDSTRGDRPPLGTGLALAASMAAVAWAVPGVAAPLPTKASDPGSEGAATIVELPQPNAPRIASTVRPATVRPAAKRPAASQPKTILAQMGLLMEALRQERSSLEADLGSIVGELAERHATPELLARVSEIESRATSLAARSTQLEVLVAELEARSAAARLVPTGESNR